MKQGWEIKNIGSIADITDYVANGSFATLRENVSYLNEEGYAILVRLADYTNGFDSSKFVYIDEHAYNFLAKSKLYGGEIIMSNVGSIGKCFKCPDLNKPMSLAPNSIVIRTPNNDFYHYVFQSFYFQSEVKRISSQTALPKFNKTSFKNINVPVPPREEQEKIVAELDCLSGVIEKKKQQLKELDALAQSIFYTMFGDPITNEKGWEVKKVRDIFSVKIGPFGSLLHNSDYISGGTPLVNPIHMHNERICPDYDFSVSEDKLKELGNYILHTDDIVLARRGDIGRCALVGMNEDGYLCGTGSLFIRPITNINSNFMIKQIRCNSMIEHLTSLAKGATMLNINCKIVEELNVILPSLTLQKEFADKIEAIEKQKELIKQSIAQTEELFNSRMDYYFN